MPTGGTSCCNNRDYIALQFSHLRNNISPIHGGIVDSASGAGAVNKAARIGPTLDFFDDSFNCTAASEANDIGLLLNHDALGITTENVGAWHDSYHRCAWPANTIMTSLSRLDDCLRESAYDLHAAAVDSHGAFRSTP